MNWLDIILTLTGIISLIVGVILLSMAYKDDEIGIGICLFAAMLALSFFTGIVPFLKLDKGKGSTIGIITSVDQNFFGTTSVYIKTSETNQEKYCIEDEKIVEKAKDLIDKKVKVSYGTRVGLYSTGRCGQAPIESIIEQ